MGSLAKSKSRTAAKPSPAARKRSAAKDEDVKPSGVDVPAAPPVAVAETAPASVAVVTEAPASAPAPIRTSAEPGLARKVTDSREHETQVVTFLLGGEEYAIDILQVQEIVMMTDITRMPKAPRFIEGIVNLRGQMIPIIDMRKRLELSQADTTDETRIIIVNVARETVGMVVDGVREVLRIPDEAISPPPKMIRGISSEYLRGIGRLGERLLIMLDLERIFSAEEQDALRTLGPDGNPLSVE